MKKHLATLAVLTAFVSTSLALDNVYSRSGGSGTAKKRTPSSSYSTTTPARTNQTQTTSRQKVIRYSDRDLASMARRSLERDSDLSTDARNVNIKVRHGRAMIQGFVPSIEESQAVRRKVLAIDGVNAVENKLSVKE